MIIWFTGQPGSGKTTLAKALDPDWHIDGDDLRLLDNPGYDTAGRRQNIDRAQAIAAYLDAQWGGVIAVSLIAPYRDQREAFKKRCKVLEVYLHTTETRGREAHFVEDYEPPQSDARYIDTGVTTIDEAIRLIRRTLATASRGA